MCSLNLIRKRNMDISTEQIEKEFKRQVQLCRGVGKEKMEQLLRDFWAEKECDICTPPKEEVSKKVAEMMSGKQTSPIPPSTPAEDWDFVSFYTNKGRLFVEQIFKFGRETGALIDEMYHRKAREVREDDTRTQRCSLEEIIYWDRKAQRETIEKQAKAEARKEIENKIRKLPRLNARQVDEALRGMGENVHWLVSLESVLASLEDDTSEK